MQEERLQHMETKVDRVESDLSRLEVTIARGFAEAKDDRRQIQDQIRQLAEGHASVRAEIQRGFERLHDVIDRRIQPLEDKVSRLPSR